MINERASCPFKLVSQIPRLPNQFLNDIADGKMSIHLPKVRKTRKSPRNEFKRNRNLLSVVWSTDGDVRQCEVLYCPIYGISSNSRAIQFLISHSSRVRAWISGTEICPKISITIKFLVNQSYTATKGLEPKVPLTRMQVLNNIYLLEKETCTLNGRFQLEHPQQDRSTEHKLRISE